jgi:DNA-binding beta-propeller fold protein YncE
MTLGNRQGTPGNNDSHDAFDQPTNLTFAANGNIYIADGYVNGRVIEFTQDGEYVRHWGTNGKGDGMFHLVHDVTIDSKGLVYVADRVNERVQIFDETGKFLGKWTDIGSPWGICYVARENVIYMCDGKYDRVTKLSLDGKVLGMFGEWGKVAGKFDYLHGLAVDTDDSIYTVEIKNWRVQKWIKQ